MMEMTLNIFVVLSILNLVLTAVLGFFIVRVEERTRQQSLTDIELIMDLAEVVKELQDIIYSYEDDNHQKHITIN